MRVLVTGVKGQRGHDVMDELAAKGIEGIGVDVEEMDITDAAACEKVITEANIGSSQYSINDGLRNLRGYITR